jgi:bifunctional non-homologous end joining protein LigD
LTAGTLTAEAMPVGERFEVEVDGRRVRLSNLDRVLYPSTGFTKADLIDYCFEIAPVLLPHLEGRPLSMRRYPSGVEEGGFWEKRCPTHRPEWVETATIFSEARGEDLDYCVVGDRATLVWAANLADIEFHTSLATAAARQTPTSMVFDLDPGEPAGMLDCAGLALLVRGTLAELGLESFAKTSGSKGIQIYVPLNGEATYGQTKTFARSLAREFASRMPDRVVWKMTRSLREGKVLIDWSQNDESKTTVCVYSPRARQRPAVSTPVSWGELETALDQGEPDLLAFSPADVLQRVAESGDLFAPLLTLRQAVP